MSEKLKELTRRVTGASQGQLVVITYDLLKESLDCLRDLVRDKNKAGYKEEATYTLKVIHYLMETLNFEEKMSYDLASLYLYVEKLIVRCSISMSEDLMEEARGIIDILYKGFEQIKDHTKGHVMQNTQKVYAGLTYGKGTLNEYVDQDVNRGFKA